MIRGLAHAALSGAVVLLGAVAAGLLCDANVKVQIWPVAGALLVGHALVSYAFGGQGMRAYVNGREAERQDVKAALLANNVRLGFVAGIGYTVRAIGVGPKKAED